MQVLDPTINTNSIAIIAQSGIKNDRPETLVVSLDPKAKTSVGIIEYTARLYTREDTAKKNDDGIVVYMPIVPLDYYVLIQGEVGYNGCWVVCLM